MIYTSDITQWSVNHPWATRDDIEQDLLLSQAICEIANDSLLGNELIIRGGTAFHKLFLPKPFRYSEDLDYVRSSAGGIGPIMIQLVTIGDRLGYKTNSSLAKFPKVFWKGMSESGQSLRIKIEINTHERTPALPLTTVSHIVNTENNNSLADVVVFQPEELIATKIRALYQRSKGRDLFDIWLSIKMLALDPLVIIDAFAPYRPEGITAELAIKNLEKKLESRRFLEDIDGLAILREIEYNPRSACEVVVEKLLRLL
jgi:predicted nucleotidyltransferase component of viral defense system